MTNPNDPASATRYVEEHKEVLIPGLTKREYFAAMAMQFFCHGLAAETSSMKDKTLIFDVIAKNSVIAADALIAELSK